MSTTTPLRRIDDLVLEIRKVAAFFRRDLLVSFSYRMSFFNDWFGVIVQLVTFSYVSKLVDPAQIPGTGGTSQGYLEFVIVGLVVSSFLNVGLGRVVSSIRSEQMLGTLEMLLITPTAPATMQLGVVAYALVYVPIRSALLLLGLGLLFGVDLYYSGLLPFSIILLAFIPFVWGVGVTSAASVLAFRRGGVTGLIAVGLTLTSGAFFPLELLPGWVERIADFNPLAIALRGAREAMLRGTGAADAVGVAVSLLPFAAGALGIGFLALRLALRRERRRGSLGLY